MQGFVYFKNPRSFSSVQKQFAPRHVEKSVAPLEAITYCKKEGKYTERGTQPVWSKKDRSRKGGAASKENYRDFISLARTGQYETILDKHPGLAVQHYRSMFAFNKDFGPQVPNLSQLDNYWFFGPPGTGKSHRARTMFPGKSVYVKPPTKWWDGYQGEPVVVIDDIGSKQDYLVDFIKVWSDKYPFQAEVKGGSMKIRPEIVIITSNRSIEELFSPNYPIDVAPLKRRFKEEFMGEEYHVPLFINGVPVGAPDDDSFPSLSDFPVID